jgi:SSS family solute:Na+ symporter
MKDFVNSINIVDYLTTLDWTVLIGVFIATYSVVFLGKNQLTAKKEKESFIDIILMGRRLTLPLFVVTLVSTWYGGIFGVTELAFEEGLYNWVTQGFFWYFTYIIFALFIVQRIRASNPLTLSELCGGLFGKKAEKISIFLNFVNLVPTAYVMSIGIFINSLWGVPFHYATVLGLLFILLYSSFGGFESIVLSDVVQFFIMFVAVALVLFFSVGQFGGIDFLTKNLPEQHMSFTGSMGLLDTFSWGLIALTTLVDPNFHQRSLAAETSSTAKKGILISTIVWILFDICTTFGALYAKALIPEADAANAYLYFSMQILPPGFRGLLIAGIFCTILSTMDSYIFGASNILSYDLVYKYTDLRKKFSEKAIQFAGLIFTALVALGLSNYFHYTGSGIAKVWKVLGSMSASFLLVPLSCKLLFKLPISDRAFLNLCIAASFFVLTYYALEKWGQILDIPIVYIGMIPSSLYCLYLSFKPKAPKVHP